MSMNTMQERPTLVWDTHSILQQQANALALLEQGEAANGAQTFDLACADPDPFTFEWEGLIDALTAVIAEMNPAGDWRAWVHDFGWRRLCGESFFFARDGQTFLRELLPRTACLFNLYVDPSPPAIRLQNFHHDSPYGDEWYRVMPIGAAGNDGFDADADDDGDDPDDR